MCPPIVAKAGYKSINSFAKKERNGQELEQECWSENPTTDLEYCQNIWNNAFLYPQAGVVNLAALYSIQGASGLPKIERGHYERITCHGDLVSPSSG